MSANDRFQEAIRRIDAAHREDPRTDVVDGVPQPREWLFAVRVYEWVRRLVKEPSEALLLAARGHTLGRWRVPRDQYPKTTRGYHQWRDACAKHHADETETILRAVGYEEATLAAVRALILKTHWPESAEASALEDADCLVFLETKLSQYVDEWDEPKALRILRGSLEKMTPQARALAQQLTLGHREQALLQRAMQPD